MFNKIVEFDEIAQPDELSFCLDYFEMFITKKFRM